MRSPSPDGTAPRTRAHGLARAAHGTADEPGAADDATPRDHPSARDGAAAPKARLHKRAIAVRRREAFVPSPGFEGAVRELIAELVGMIGGELTGDPDEFVVTHRFPTRKQADEFEEALVASRGPVALWTLLAEITTSTELAIE